MARHHSLLSRPQPAQSPSRTYRFGSGTRAVPCSSREASGFLNLIPLSFADKTLLGLPFIVFVT